MSCLAGYIGNFKGDVSSIRKDIRRDRLEAQSVIGYLPETARGFDELTVRDFLNFCVSVRLQGRIVKQAIRDVCNRIELAPALKQPMGELS